MSDAIHKKLAAYRKAAELGTFTGSAADLPACVVCANCSDGTGTCRYRRIDGGMLWSCDTCHKEWIVPTPEPEPEAHSPWWAVLGLVAILVSVAAIFWAGYAAALALRAWGFA